VSTNVLVNNGVAYVPIRMWLQRLDMAVEKRPDGLGTCKAGGANQVEGLQGKVGDDLFNGGTLAGEPVTRQDTYTGGTQRETQSLLAMERIS